VRNAVSTIVSVFMLAALAAGARAQVVEKKGITLDGARKAIAAAMVEARRDNGGGVIAVVDEGGNLVALERLDGTFAAGAAISTGKARTAALFKRPTAVFEDVVAKGRVAMVALPDFTPLRGGVPITVEGQIVGAIGVSGAASAQRDEEIANAGAAAFGASATSESSAPHSLVSYFDKNQVGASFAKGAVLFDRGERYMVHTSHRDAAGKVEVHGLDTDIIYVVDGTCTFVTGGSVVGGKEIAPNEVRGESIDGGQERTLAKGDVIIVPAGTPHWFKSVPGPINYYTVKSR
jgi:uncharacterized protein GlcG (DUF336 family)/mannose-6-phosphate isomerase-like protein (cupin superfamily)